MGLNIKRPQQQNLAEDTDKKNIIISCIFSATEEPGVAPPDNYSPEKIGFSNLIPEDESDNVVRRGLLFADPSPDNRCRSNYSFAIMLAAHYLYKIGFSFDFNEDNSFNIGEVVFSLLQRNSGGYINIDNKGYQILINYRNHRDIAKTVTLTDILTDKVNPNLIKDRIVIIGNSARILESGILTPYSTSKEIPTVPTLFVHAQITSQIISTVLDGRPLIWYFPEWLEALWVCGWSIIGGVIVWKLGYKWQTYLVVGTSIFSLVGICYILFLQASWVPVVPTATALIISCLSVGSISYLILIRINRK